MQNPFLAIDCWPRQVSQAGQWGISRSEVGVYTQGRTTRLAQTPALWCLRSPERIFCISAQHGLFIMANILDVQNSFGSAGGNPRRWRHAGVASHQGLLACGPSLSLITRRFDRHRQQGEQQTKKIKRNHRHEHIRNHPSRGTCRHLV
jgi:hypothetical protein